MTHPSDNTPAKTTVRRILAEDAGERVWHVTYSCGCDPRRFRSFWPALTFATRHKCPDPWPEPIGRRRGSGRWWF